MVAVTGAARGIGRATAAALERAGARVARGDVDPDGDGSALFVDVRDPVSFEGFLAAVEERLGPLSALVNNAGINHLGPLTGQSEEAIDRQIDVNLRGTINGVRAAAPRMLARGDGHVVNVASVAGRLPLPGAAVYCATKHAIVGLSEAARAELRPGGVRVSVVLPHMTRTDMTAGQPENRLAPPIAPEAVGAAVAGVLARPRATVYVPGRVRVLAALIPHLPAAARDAFNRVTGADRAFEYDAAERAAYHRRVLGAGDGRG